jgi:phage terminase large subunit
MEPIPETTLETHSTTDLNREYDEFVANELRKDMEARVYFKLDEPAPKKKRTYKRKAVSPEPEKVEGNVFSPYSMPINATFYLGETDQVAPEPKNVEMEYYMRRMIEELATANRIYAQTINTISALSTKL